MGLACIITIMLMMVSPPSTGAVHHLPSPGIDPGNYYQVPLKQPLPAQWEYSTDGVKWQLYPLKKVLTGKLFYLRTRTNGKEWIDKFDVADAEVRVSLTISYLGRFVVDISINHTYPRGIFLEEALTEARQVSDEKVLTDRLRAQEYNIYLSIIQLTPTKTAGTDVTDLGKRYLSISDAFLIFEK